jgi:hypothetical protein
MKESVKVAFQVTALNVGREQDILQAGTATSLRNACCAKVRLRGSPRNRPALNEFAFPERTVDGKGGPDCLELP